MKELDAMHSSGYYVKGVFSKLNNYKNIGESAVFRNC